MRTLLIAFTLLFASPAFAQDEEAAAPPADTSETGGSAEASGSASGEAYATGDYVPTEETPDDFSNANLTLGLKVGLYVPSIVNALGLHADIALEAAFLLPFLERRLGIAVELGYSPPGVSGSGTDMRIGDAGGPWTYEVVTKELMLALGPIFRFLPPGSPIVPYAGVLFRTYFLETSSEGTGGAGKEAFGENTEQSTEFGVSLLLGGELRLGPGAALFEISFGTSSLPHRITGDTSTGALAFLLGYRLFI